MKLPLKARQLFAALVRPFVTAGEIETAVIRRRTWIKVGIGSGLLIAFCGRACRPGKPFHKEGLAFGRAGILRLGFGHLIVTGMT